MFYNNNKLLQNNNLQYNSLNKDSNIEGLKSFDVIVYKLCSYTFHKTSMTIFSLMKKFHSPLYNVSICQMNLAFKKIKV